MKKFICYMTCFCLSICPQLQLAAQVTKSQASQVVISDVALGAQGKLQGRAVDGQGQPLAAAKVTVSKNRQVIATTITTKEGAFAVNGLETGIYEIQTGDRKASFRAWEGQVAPPTAKQNVLLVSGDISRAQAGLLIDPLDTVLLGLSITGVVLGATALSDDGETIVVSP